MPDLAQLNLVINSEQAAQATKRMDDMARAGKNAEDSANKLTDSHKKLEDGTSRLEHGFTKVLEVLGELTALYGVYRTVVSSLEEAAAMEQTGRAFVTLLKNEKDAVEMLENLKGLAAKTGIEFEVFGTAAKKMLGVGIEGQKIVPILGAVSSAVRAMGGGGEQIDSISNALARMIAKGKLTQRELLVFVQANIDATALLAEGTGNTIDHMRKAIEQDMLDGRLAAEVIVDQLQKKFGKETQSEFSRALVETQRLRVAISQAGEGVATEFLRDFQIDKKLAALIPIIHEIGSVAKEAFKLFEGLHNNLVRDDWTKGFAAALRIILGLLTALIALETVTWLVNITAKFLALGGGISGTLIPAIGELIAVLLVLGAVDFGSKIGKQFEGITEAMQNTFAAAMNLKYDLDHIMDKPAPGKLTTGQKVDTAVSSVNYGFNEAVGWNWVLRKMGYSVNQPGAISDVANAASLAYTGKPAPRPGDTYLAQAAIDRANWFGGAGAGGKYGAGSQPSDFKSLLTSMVSDIEDAFKAVAGLGNKLSGPPGTMPFSGSPSRSGFLNKKGGVLDPLVGNIDERDTIGKQMTLMQRQVDVTLDSANASELAAQKQHIQTEAMKAYGIIVPDITDEIEVFMAHVENLTSKEEKVAMVTKEWMRIQHELDLGKLKYQINDNVKALQDEANALTVSGDKREALQLKQKIANDALKVGITDSKEYALQLRNAEAALAKFQEVQKLDRIVQGVGNSFETAFTDIALNVNNATEAIHAFALAVEKLLVQELAAKPAADMLKNLLGSVIPSLAGLGGKGDFSTAGGSAAAGGGDFGSKAAMGHAYYGGVEMYAMGGYVDRPTVFGMAGGRVGMMGEKGGEIVMPAARMSDGTLGVKAVGGGHQSVKQQVVNVNVYTKDADSFRRSKKQLGNAVRSAMSSQSME